MPKRFTGGFAAGGPEAGSGLAGTALSAAAASPGERWLSVTERFVAEVKVRPRFLPRRRRRRLRLLACAGATPSLAAGSRGGSRPVEPVAGGVAASLAVERGGRSRSSVKSNRSPQQLTVAGALPNRVRPQMSRHATAPVGVCRCRQFISTITAGNDRSVWRDPARVRARVREGAESTAGTPLRDRRCGLEFLSVGC